MKFNYNDTNYTENEIIRSWHPTLCPTLDYHYVYRIGGGDPLKGLFGQSSNNVDIFDLYTMTNRKLPNMKYARAKSSATMLPPTIPFHDYQDTEEYEDTQPPDLNKLFIQQFKNPRIPRPPPPPVLDMQSMDDLLNELADDDDDEDDDEDEDEENDDNKDNDKDSQVNGNEIAKTNEDTKGNEKLYKVSTSTSDTNGDTTAPLAPMAPKKQSPTNLSPANSPASSPSPPLNKDDNKLPTLSPHVSPTRDRKKYNKKMPTTPPPPKPIPKLPPSPNTTPLTKLTQSPPYPKVAPISIQSSTSSPSNTPPSNSPKTSPIAKKSPPPLGPPLTAAIVTSESPVVVVQPPISTAPPAISTASATSEPSIDAAPVPSGPPIGAAPIPSGLPISAAPIPTKPPIAAAPMPGGAPIPIPNSNHITAPVPILEAPPIASITAKLPKSVANGGDKSNEPSINYGGRRRNNSRKSSPKKSSDEYPEYCLFVSGGLNGSKLHKKTEIFYPYEGQWNPVMNMKQARCGHIAQYLGRTHWKQTLRPSNINGNMLNCLEMNILEWKDISDLTTKVFVCGGRREHGNGITSCEVFDIESNKWSMCQRAPFTNHGYQSGCWWSNKQCVAMISDPMDGNQVAIYKPDINKWTMIENINKLNDKTHKKRPSLKPNNFMTNQPRNDMHLTHFYPLIGTLYLFGQEYLYIMGDDYKFKSLELYDDRNNKWIPIGITYKTIENDQSIKQKHDKLLHLTQNKQFDAFHSIS